MPGMRGRNSDPLRVSIPPGHLWRGQPSDFFERYRAMPMVRGGVFAWSSNAMYAFVFLGLWGVALTARSQAALAVALFQHAYIWVHWYCTEQPDGVVLYGRSPDDGEPP